MLLRNTLAAGILLVLFLLTRLLELRNNEAALSLFGTVFGDAPILTSHDDTRLPDTSSKLTPSHDASHNTVPRGGRYIRSTRISQSI